MIVEKINTILCNVAWAVLCFIVGIILGSLLQHEYKITKKDIIDNFSKVQKYETEVNEDIQKLLVISKNDKNPSVKLLSNFDYNISLVRNYSEKMTNKISNLNTTFENYENSMIELRNASHQLNNTVEKKEFIKTWNEYKTAQENFHTKIEIH